MSEPAQITLSKRAVWRATMALSQSIGLLTAIRDEFPALGFLSNDIARITSDRDALIDAYPEDAPQVDAA